MLQGGWGRKKGKKERKDKERQIKEDDCDSRVRRCARAHLDVVVVLEEDLAQTRLAHGVVLHRQKQTQRKKTHKNQLAFYHGALSLSLSAAAMCHLVCLP